MKTESLYSKKGFFVGDPQDVMTYFDYHRLPPSEGVFQVKDHIDPDHYRTIVMINPHDGPGVYFDTNNNTYVTEHYIAVIPLELCSAQYILDTLLEGRGQIFNQHICNVEYINDRLTLDMNTVLIRLFFDKNDFIEPEY